MKITRLSLRGATCPTKPKAKALWRRRKRRSNLKDILEIASSRFCGTRNDSYISPFQKKVYKVVLSIPRGRVRTYKWVACKIGRPKAARAIGQALKKNPYTITIPCHRVIKSDGSLGGYSRGACLKRRLLAQEGSTLSKPQS